MQPNSHLFLLRLNNPELGPAISAASVAPSPAPDEKQAKGTWFLRDNSTFNKLTGCNSLREIAREYRAQHPNAITQGVVTTGRAING
jgi:hypothetical protein